MPETLKRAVTTPLLFFFILGDVLGAGVYVLVGNIARESGGAVWLPLLSALVLAALTAGSYAELATKYPRAGGSASYVTTAFGPAAGSFIGFCMLAAGVVSVAALARAFAGDYLRALVSVPTLVVVVIFLALLAALNIRGIKESLGANVVATAVELGGLLLIIGAGAWVMLRGDADLDRLTQVGAAEHGAVGAVLAGTVLAFYSFVGFETSVNLAEEVKDPRRSYPTALFGALLTAGVVYSRRRRCRWSWH
ncbi:APC family permease [Nocardia fluminea]|uniref:APC family permease n=1 Tax=Nocardia fluminea TaxID=134984 RepID=UPI003D0BB283